MYSYSTVNMEIIKNNQTQMSQGHHICLPKEMITEREMTFRITVILFL